MDKHPADFCVEAVRCSRSPICGRTTRSDRRLNPTLRQIEETATVHPAEFIMVEHPLLLISKAGTCLRSRTALDEPLPLPSGKESDGFWNWIEANLSLWKAEKRSVNLTPANLFAATDGRRRRCAGNHRTGDEDRDAYRAVFRKRVPSAGATMLEAVLAGDFSRVLSSSSSATRFQR